MRAKTENQPAPFVPNVLRHYRGSDLYGPTGLLGVSRSTFYSLIKAGKLPKPVKVNSLSLWPEASIVAALAALQGE